MSILLAMAAYSLVMSISPGPVNLISLSIGANSGYRKALPFVSGATIGFTLLLLLIGAGLGEFAMKFLYFMKTMSVIGALFICFIGYIIATSDGSLEMQEEGLPGFRHGFLLQWLNPKAWAACLAGVAIFGSSESNGPLYTFVAIYFSICFFGIGCWAVFGDKAFKFVKNSQRMRCFNRIMGGTLIVVALFMLFQQLNTD